MLLGDGLPHVVVGDHRGDRSEDLPGSGCARPRDIAQRRRVVVVVPSPVGADLLVTGQRRHRAADWVVGDPVAGFRVRHHAVQIFLSFCLQLE